MVEMRARNGSARFATIFARAVSPRRNSPEGRYRAARSRMMNGIRSWMDAEVVKRLPRSVNRSRDQNNGLRTRGGDRRVHRLSDRRNRSALRVRTEGKGDLIAAEGAWGLRPAGVHVGGERPEGRRNAREILVIEDTDDERDL